MNACRISMTAILLLPVFALAVQTVEIFSQQRLNVERLANIPEGCSLTEPPELESLYSFTRAQLQALSLARRGELANLEVLTAQEDVPMERMTQVLTGLREERIENSCSEFILSAYSESADERVATTAKVLVMSYQTLGTMSDQMLRIIRYGMLERNRAATQDRLLQWRNKRRELLSGMVTAVNYSLGLLIDQSRTDSEGKPDHMILTRAQRDKLTNYVRAKFPSLDAEKKIGHSGDFIEQAILIQSFLAGKYKAADE